MHKDDEKRKKMLPKSVKKRREKSETNERQDRVCGCCSNNLDFGNFL